jgi:UDP-N-acetylbacillosamine N-acetyltransferase
MSTQPAIVIWGASGHASVVADVVRCEGKFRIAGLIDDLHPQRRTLPAGEVLGDAGVLPELKRGGVTHTLIAVGNNAARVELARRVVALGFELATAIHPRATVAGGVTIGPGTVVMAGAVINPGAAVGGNVIINTCASVDHDGALGDGVHICPGAHLAGHVTVGAGTMIGIGAAVRDRVRIGARCVIGAGAAVVHDIPDDAVAVGVPARVIRSSAAVVA